VPQLSVGSTIEPFDHITMYGSYGSPSSILKISGLSITLSQSPKAEFVVSYENWGWNWLDRCVPATSGPSQPGLSSSHSTTALAVDGAGERVGVSVAGGPPTPVPVGRRIAMPATATTTIAATASSGLR
jgi:hypothetical protein